MLRPLQKNVQSPRTTVQLPQERLRAQKRPRLRRKTLYTLEGTQITAEEDMVTPEESTVATEETTTSDTAHEKDRITKTHRTRSRCALTYCRNTLCFRDYSLPEGLSLSPVTKPTEDAVVVACPPAPEAILAAVQTVEEPAV
ncbi:hypothetical protein AYO20_11505 [Fonsecaea nubica]|uniref:Uncharacterized protein n=1 Tax=Fonsecaea nubica TaxID=856822 RepID=A0A178BT45_9EURO|nr:hypothetical protein AYO20_11505 [Fonsecaea nubica]OAL20354.1 hypothetical protein AYO20_11505 [Fonsecaea nubica]